MSSRNAFEQGKAAIDETASNLRDGVKRADRAAVKAGRAAVEAGEDALDMAEAAATDAIDAANGMSQRALDAASEKWDEASEAFGQWTTAAIDTVRRYPLASAAAVGVAGLILGSVLRSRR